MSANIPTNLALEFGSNVELLVQQRGSHLQGSVRMVPISGAESHFVEQIGAQDAVLRTSRHADSPLLDTPSQVTRIDMLDFEWGDLVDTFDQAKTKIGITGAYTQTAAMAMGRAIDAEIITRATGSVIRASGGTSPSSATSSTFSSFNSGSQLIAVDYVETGATANSDLTVGKLRQARMILREGEVSPDEELFIAVRASQIHALLRDDEVTSSDFNIVKALVNGEIDTYMGFKFITTQLLDNSTLGTDQTTCFAWARSGIALSKAMEVTSRVEERPDKSFSVYVYYAMSIGAARLEDEKVVQIACDESP